MRIILSTILLLLPWGGLVAQEKLEFGRDVRPILSEHCFACHGPDEADRKAGLRLDLAESALRDRDGTRVVVPGDPDASELIRRIAPEDPDDVMPPPETKHPLSPEQVAILRRWIDEGASFADHWAFVAPTRPALPVTRTRVGHPVDAFVVARLEEVGLSPSSRASRETLVRRATLDLTGLPPTLDEIDAFVADDDPRAFEKLIDRLLPKDRVAERLALDWLDAARYADTNGYSIDDHRDMWVWRDWVIRAFRDNKPYDTFLVEQIAGDLLPEATVDQRVATGFLRNAMNTHEDGTIAEEYRVASIADKMDTVATVFMGLTLECARCHDHKYDPISQEEYYRFFALFNDSTEGGKGAKNGNTAPILTLDESRGGRAEVVAAYERRRADLTTFLRRLHAERRRTWERGLRSSGETRGARAGPPLARGADAVFRAAKARWVWAPDVTPEDSLTVVRSFSLARVPAFAELAVSCDNNGQVWLNGVRLARVDPWTKPYCEDVSDRLREGENTLRITARNAGGVAGLLVALVDGDGGAMLSTTKDWTFSRDAAAESQSALPAKGRVKDLGPYGAAPWGRFSSQTPDREELRRLAAIPEPERTYRHWRRLLTGFAGTLEGAERTLVDRQLAAIKGERELVDSYLSSRKPSVMVMDGGVGRKTHVLMRGQYDQPGRVVTAGVPRALAFADRRPVTDRLELARWMTDARHPLTARVVVNRYWQMLMGAGIVRTTEDFGSQGEWPSHPDLLDWLAVSFVEHDWNVRWLLKTIMLSSTYQQSSHSTARGRERDPSNRWLARANRFRLPAEAVRDNALHVAGLLTMSVGGPSVYPDQPDGLWRQVSHFGYSGFFSAQSFYPSVGADRYRRSMYTFWKRTAPPPALTAFDAPNREVCTVRRPVTNTPLQALVTLNEPQFMNAARGLAVRMSRRGDDVTSSIVRGFRLCTGRRPRDAELAVLRAAHERHLAHFRDAPEAAGQLIGSRSTDAAELARLASMTMLASTLLNLDETVTRP